jgi:UDP-glucose 4-epimerase
MTARYLITGGAGFIGAHLVGRLLLSGCRVTVLDDFSTRKRQRLSLSGVAGRLTVLAGDIRDPAVLQKAMINMDGVFHLAAHVSVSDCIADWPGSHAVNATAMLRLFDLDRGTGRVPIVYASSAAVYGDRGDAPCSEDMAERPISPYGADKLSCEHEARAFWTIHRIPSAGLRFFNVYGPGQCASSSYAGVITRVATALSDGEAPEIHGNGLQSRDFVHVSDTVGALVASLDRIMSTPQALVRNVCAGTSHSVLDLAAMITEQLGAPYRVPVHGPERPGEIRISRGNPELLQRTLDLGPFRPLRDGLGAWIGRPAMMTVAS